MDFALILAQSSGKAGAIGLAIILVVIFLGAGIAYFFYNPRG